MPPLTKIIPAGARRVHANNTTRTTTQLVAQQGSSPLSPIVGSPTKMIDKFSLHSPGTDHSPMQQMKTPFGLVNCRTKTFPTMPMEGSYIILLGIYECQCDYYYSNLLNHW